MRMQLLVDSDQFWGQLAEDIRSATKYAFFQTLSFEGDRVGQALVGALLASDIRDRRILVDSYTKFIQNDRFLYTPRNLLNRDLRAEVRETSRMIREARQAGIGIKFTNPMGLFLLRFAARNHKKIVAIDDRICYVGGMNFSEHNFAWHDLMVRIEDESATQFLRDDFLATWQGHDVPASRRVQGIELHSCDGASSPRLFQRVFDLIDGAEREIYVESPYLTFPFCERLGEAVRRGVHVVVVTPRNNNHKTLQRYVTWEASRQGFDLRLYGGGMTHLKAMLIDGRSLIVGSSNFDVLSYYLHQEIVAIVSDAALIADFTKRVVEPDLAASERARATAPTLSGSLANKQLRAAARLVTLGRRVPG